VDGGEAIPRAAIGLSFSWQNVNCFNSQNGVNIGQPDKAAFSRAG
jgi:hypothetical protein